jgi:hypothetical protein
MKIKNFILPVLALILILIYIVLETSKEKYEVQKLFPDNLKINKITYYGDGINFVVEKDNKTDEWILVEPEKWAANKDDISDLINAFKNVDIITELGTVGDNNTYEITRNKYLLLEDGGQAYKLYIGKRDPSYKMVYVKLNEDKLVKLVDAAFTNYLPSSLNQIKDKRVYSFDKDKLTNYIIKIDNKTFELTLNNGKYFIDNESLEDNVSKVLIQDISTMTANTFVDKNLLDNATKDGFIKFTVDNTTKTFEIYNDKDGDYLIPTACKSTFKIYNFTIDRFLKKFSKL